MEKQDPKIFLLNLLDDNQEKINYISETKCSKELFSIYQELKNCAEIDYKTDHSQIHDYKVKENILNHEKLSGYHKYKICLKECHKSLKQKAFEGFFKSYWLFNPLFLYRVLKYKKTVDETPARVTILLSTWQGFCFTLMAALFFTKLWFAPILFLVSASLAWYLILQAPRKVINEFLEMTGLGLFLMLAVPLIIPLAFCLGFGVFLMLGVERVAEKTYTNRPYNHDDDDYPHFHNHSGRWGRD